MTVKIYTTPTCGICKMAKQKMKDKNIPFEELPIDDYIDVLDVMTAPALEVEDGVILTGAGEIVNWINNYEA